MRAATDMDCRGGGDFRQSFDHLQERVKSPLSSSSSVSEDGEIDRVAFSRLQEPAPSSSLRLSAWKVVIVSVKRASDRRHSLIRSVAYPSKLR